MRRKNLWLRLSSCTMAALIATTSIVPVSAADVEFQDEVSAETPDTEAEEVSEAPEAEVQEQEDITLTTEENTDQAAAELQDAEDAAELTAEDGFSDGDAVVQEAAADAVSDTVQTGFGSANTSLEKGAYAVTVTLMNASDPTKESMAASCIAGKGTLVVAEDGSAKLTVPIQAANVRGQVAYAKDWKVYKNSEKTESTDAEYTVDEDGNVNSITFDIPDKTQDGVYVSMYIELMNAIQDAFMNVDYANAEKEQVGVDTTALEAAIAQADALDEMAYTKASWDGNKEAIDTANAAAKEALEKKESQEAVDAAATALTNAMGKLVAAGDQTELKEVLAQAKALNETDYTVKTWKYVQDAIDTAEEVIANRDTKTKVRRAKSSLNTWMGQLVRKYDTTVLEQKIAQAEALDKNDYTAESWKAANLANTINAAKEVIENRGNKDDVHDAIEKLETAIEKLVPVSNEVTVGRGNFQKKLAPGTYSLPIELLNGGKSETTNQYTSANYMSQVSMAAGCFTGNATLVIHEDGTATLTTGVQAISAMGMTGAASDWTIYENTQDYLDGTANATTGARFKARVDASKVQAGKKKPSQISFTIPDLKQNVVATLDNLSEGTNATKLATLSDGVYKLNGQMVKVNKVDMSMSNNAINHNVKLVMKDGLPYISMNFNSLTVGSLKGYLKDLNYYATGYTVSKTGEPSGTLLPVQVDSLQKFSNGKTLKDDFGTNYPNDVTFPLCQEAMTEENGEYVPMQVFVPIMDAITAGTGKQNVYLKLDYSTLKKTTADDKDFAETEKAPTDPSAIKAQTITVTVKNTKGVVSKKYGDKVPWRKGKNRTDLQVFQHKDCYRRQQR